MGVCVCGLGVRCCSSVAAKCVLTAHVLTYLVVWVGCWLMVMVKEVVVRRARRKINIGCVRPSCPACVCACVLCLC